MMFERLAAMLRNDAGTATAEYSLVLAVFAVATIGIFQAFITQSNTNLTTTQTNLQSTAMTLPIPLATPLPSSSPM